jgi:negative regulator of flagellin synthesis FlgM
MRVDGFAQVHGPQGIRPPHHLGGAGRVAGTKPGDVAGPMDKVDFSPAAVEAVRAAEAAEVRQAHLASIRQQIAAGTYETPERIDRAVERLLDELG